MGNNQNFTNLFQPLQIGPMELRNRIVMPAMFTALASEDGCVTQRLKDYYEARAKGGVGLIIIAMGNVHADGRSYAKQLGVSDDSFVPGLSELVRVVQGQGAAIAIQLSYKWRDMAIGEFREVVEHHASAARRVRQAGFNAIEIGSTLIKNLISPASNKRQDSYGGSLSNRTRLMVEVLTAVKNSAGAGVSVCCRLDGKEPDEIEGGLTIEEAQEVARIAQNAGADVIHVYVGASGWPLALGKRPMASPELVFLTEGIKKAVSVPVITVGAIDPESGERILREKKADLIAMGRAMIADPQLPNKLARGKLDDVIPCIHCMKCIDRVDYTNDPIECSVNPETGWEKQYTVYPADKPKKIVVVGGGPAGMEVAKVASSRGHQVSLFEKKNILGGQLLPAAIPPHKVKIDLLTKYLEKQINVLGVKVELGKQVTSALLEALEPDVLVVATGAIPIIPEMPVMEGSNVVTAIDVLTEHKKVGRTVVIVGGGQVGCETAEFLAEQHKEVTILEMVDEIGADIGPHLKPIELQRLKEAHVRMEVGVRAVEITKRGVRGIRRGVFELFEGETVVLAVGMKSEKTLMQHLEGITKDLHLIGDCVKPRSIKEAIAEGFHVGRKL